MAKEEIVFEVSVDGSGSGAKSLKTLKAEFKQLQSELEKTQVGTKAYQQALERLGNVRDEIGDLNQTINALNPEGKVQAFANVAGKLAGGFQAATGAAALFGVQSEELEKTLLRVQAATALSQGIQSVVGLTDAFKVLGTVIAANPIMAIAGVLVTATAAVVAFTKETDKLTVSLEDQKDEVDRLKQSYEDYLGLLEASGASFEELSVARVASYEQEIKDLDVLKKQYDELFGLAAEGSEEQKKAEIEFTKISQEQARLRYKIELEFVKADKYLRDEAAKNRDEASKNRIKKEEESMKELERIVKYNLAQEQADLLAQQQEFDEIFKQLEEENRQAELDSYVEFEWKKMMAALDVEKKGLAMQKEIKDKQDAENEKKLAEQTALRMKTEAAYFSAVSDLSATFFNAELAAANGNAKEEEKIRKKQFQADKALRVVQSIMNTAESVTATLKTPPLAIAIAIAGAAQIAKILSTQYTGGGSTASADTSVNLAPQIQTGAPNIGNPITRLNEQGQNQNFNNRVYVLESDISESQGRVAKLQEQATF